MSYLVAAVVLVGLLCMVNLLLTVGVIRRLRRQAAQADAHADPMRGEGLVPGDRLPDFAATTTGGEPISGELLGGPALVGFFSVGCEPCEKLLPRFVEHARRTQDAVLAVVAAEPGEPSEAYVDQLAQVARVVHETPGGPVQSAFKVTGYPTVLRISADGTVASSDHVMPVAAGT
jgi:thiol-disulfide isomerase/thioredoxin